MEFGRKHASTVAAVRRAGFDIAARNFVSHIIVQARYEDVDVEGVDQAAGTATPSVCQRLLQKLGSYAGTDEYDVEEEIAIDVTGAAYGGAL